MSTLEVINQKGKKVESLKLDKDIFDGKVNNTLMHQAIVIYLSNQRKGLASTKTRGEVRGGGRKPWRQKGTGRARVGSNRSPLWEGGGTTFGPKPHSFHKDMNRKMKGLALKSALNAKLKDNEIIVVDDIKLNSFKTKELCEILGVLKLDKEKVKLVVGTIESNLKMSLNNLKKVNLEKAVNLTTYGALDCKKLVFTKTAFELVEKRIRKWLI